MKTVYQCDKCGKSFTDWDDAYKCERSHKLPSEYMIIDEMAKYVSGATYPTSFIMVADAEGEDERENIVIKYEMVKISKEERHEAVISKAHGEASSEDWSRDYQRRQAEKLQLGHEETDN